MWIVLTFIRIKLCISSICCKRQQYNQIKIVSESHLPWIFVGCKDSNGEVINITETVNKYINYGDLVSPSFLQKLDPTYNEWFYLDKLTLNEVKIPVEGIQI